jgi:O-methyltransferase domain
MKHIFHDWDDDRAAWILENIRRTLGSAANGRVILLESINRSDNQPDLGVDCRR